MTPSREDYLKVIYTANQNDERVTNKKIANELKISPPSVSEMLNKLCDEGLIEKDADAGFLLTLDGRNDAKILLRKHRLWEVFLVDNLGYSWDNVHEEAEILEHATSDALANRLNDFLQHPKYCPHGSVIFGNGEDDIVQYSLTHYSAGTKVLIRSFSDNKRFLQYIRAKKLEIGQVIEIVSIDPFDQTYELEVMKQHIQISETAAKEIFGSLVMEGK